MDNSNLVFGSWAIGKSIGSGTDGRVVYIHRKNDDGTVDTNVMKTLFFSSNRSVSRDFNKIGAVLADTKLTVEQAVEQVANNIDAVIDNDGGKRFVKYLGYEINKSGDDFIIHVRMEQMRSLENLLREFSLTQDEAIQVALSVCKGLVRSRKLNYIYPYLKPENILFDAEGNCKLGDFGSFSYLKPSKTGIAYKKSECFMDVDFLRSGRSNTTTDTYALGMVLYMLTNRGRLPFAEPYPQPLTAAGLERGKQMRLDGAELPRPALASDELFAIIKKACAFNINDRYLHPGQMYNDLKAIKRGQAPQETKYDEVYSAAPAQSAPSPRQQMNDIGVAHGLPDQSKLHSKAPETLSFDSIMASINSAAPAKPKNEVVQPEPQDIFSNSPAGGEYYAADDAPEPENEFEPEIEQEIDEEYDEPVKEKKTLLEQIKIPNIRRKDYVKGKTKNEAKPDGRARRFFVHDLPQDDVDRNHNADSKKIVIITAALVLVIILLIVSCSARSSRKKENAIKTSSPTAEQTVDESESAASENASGESDSSANAENESSSAESESSSDASEASSESESQAANSEGESQVSNG